MTKGRIRDLHGRAFVTGASSGLGLAFAEMLLAEGVPVWGTSRDPARLADLAARHPGAFNPVRLDLADPAGAEAAFREAEGSVGGGFDLVVNNAGYGVFGDFATTEFEVWQGQLDAMIGGTLRLAHAAFRGMRARNRGTLVNVSSLAAEFPLPFMSGYNVAKAGLSALSESLVFECRGTSIRVIDFRPGDYRTAFNEGMRIPTAASHPLAWRNEAQRRRPVSLDGAPPPSRAAADLRRAVARNRSGVVRSGSFFQARLAPLLAGLVPASVVRAAAARYFDAKS